MKKALIVTTVSGFVPQFEMDNVRLLQSMGLEVHYAANFNTPVYSDNNDRLEGTGIICHQVDFVRSPFYLRKNLKAFRQLDKLMASISFSMVHCHTPMGGVLARLAAQKNRTAPVFYTAHGFHFYKGAPVLNWLMFYPIELFMARYTDVLITINQEDYKRAKRFKVRKGGSVEYVPGVGIEIENVRIQSENRNRIRKKWGIVENDFLILSVGELNKGKNQKIILEAIGQLILKYPCIKYMVCGVGKEEKNLRKLAKSLDISKNFILAGYQDHIYEILEASDCFAFPSLREGLSVALMEAMVAGLPVVCAKTRGNVDLIRDGFGGFLVADNKKDTYADKIEDLIINKDKRGKMGNWNRKRVKQFGKERVGHVMGKVYKQHF